MNITTSGTRPAIRFDRNELSGAFGDMGTDVPLIIGVALASHLDGASVLIMFGAMQILTGLAYRMPMPVQPLKAMAAIVIAQQTAPEILYGAGIAIGLTMLILALPQIPLSLGNSVLATRQLAHDLFPERNLTIRKIGITYAAMNLISPWLGGIPTCHGSGGMAGHYAFGGRTGGSVIIYGLIFVALGLLFGSGFDHVVLAFPLPILGVLLLFEALSLVWLIRDTADSRLDFPIAALVGLIAVGLPYGYLVGMVVGTILVWLGARVNLVNLDKH